DVVRVELERAVDLRHQAAELEDLGEILAVEAHELAQVAEESEVRVGAVVVERDGALGERLATVEVRLARLSIDGPAPGFAQGARWRSSPASPAAPRGGPSRPRHPSGRRRRRRGHPR